MMLAGKQSKFCMTLSERLAPALLEKVAFDRAEISPTHRTGISFFMSTR